MTGAYNKLIVCGDVIYWYQYDKPPTTTGRRVKPAQDGYNALDFNDTELKPKEDRKHERRAQTLRDGSNLVRQMALLNFPPAESTFLTLTFRDHVTDIRYSDEEYKKFFKRLRYQLQEPKMKYLAVRELTKEGRIHYHVLINSRMGLPTIPEGYGRYKNPRDGKTYNNSVAHQYELDYVRDKEEQVKKIWRHGDIVDVKPLYAGVDNVGAYLVKYMTKNISIDLFPGKNFYLCSQGLKRPEPIGGKQADELIQLLNLGEKKEVFGNCYETEYQGICHFKEINLKRSLVQV